MPRMGGEDLIRAARADRPGLPVLVVTGSAPSGGVEELRRRAGWDRPLLLLLKPPDHAELAVALRRATFARPAPPAAEGADATARKSPLRVAPAFSETTDSF